ncbi:DUF4389 domain-containing protein [Endozoicomonas sp. OPT23]|uniref:DUF4389 domain-containing protein n=1 Tax=Endozoicomonas sp. OPT23 TaxID=2072845 RepID=UPI00129B5CD7|nr:DUF4389 domain-containing protein [Endozoicomonas sp. OPT23]MRI34205.1 DUF4389 domain-containing protein [Endozoicomonas sp. OPT23]
MDSKIKENLVSESRWLRLVFMVLFYLVVSVLAPVVVLIAIVQALLGFISGHPNERLLSLSSSINYYIYQIIQYITFNSESKPYPFSDWPTDSPQETQEHENV